MESNKIATMVTNFVFAAYVCGLNHLHGCSAQIVLQDRVCNRRKNSKLDFHYVINQKVSGNTIFY